MKSPTQDKIEKIDGDLDWCGQYMPNEEFRDLIWQVKFYGQGKLEQGRKQCLEEVKKIIDSFDLNYYDCEVSYTGDEGSFENWANQEKERLKVKLEKLEGKK